jgi:hypothetical protein
MGQKDATVAPRSMSRRSETPIGELVAALTVEELREVVSAAADRHDDVERQVRLVAARAAGDLAQLRAEVDRGLRTRRFLGYRETMDWGSTADRRRAGSGRPDIPVKGTGGAAAACDRSCRQGDPAIGSSTRPA